MKRSFREAKWYPYAVAACIAVVLYVVLTQFTSVWGGISRFIGYFSAVIYGVVIAYMINPLASFLERKLFKGIAKEKLRWVLSSVLAIVIVLLVLSLVFVLMIPQLIDSVKTFSENLDGYVASLTRLIENLGLTGSKLDISRFVSSSESLLEMISGFITDNLDSILATSLGAGKSIVTVVIGFIFSVYILMDKRRLIAGSCRLLRASCGIKRYDKLMVFLKHADIRFIYAVKQVDENKYVFTVDPDPVDPGAFGEEIVITDALIKAGKGCTSAHIPAKKKASCIRRAY